MNQFNQSYNNGSGISQSMSGAEAQANVRGFLLRVYNWMAMGLAITGLTAYAISTSQELTALVLTPFVFFTRIIGQFLLILGINKIISSMGSTAGVGAFFLYAFATGVLFSTLFLRYTHASIYSTFFVCAMMFGAVSFLGYITKIDLSKFSTFLYMGLFGIIISSLVNLFLQSSTMYWIISNVGVLVFCGLTAYDTQKIKQMAFRSEADSESGKREAIFGALQLYLDFINMFLFLLRILGSRR